MKTPIIKCLPRPGFNGGLMFYCPFCQKWHLHGGTGHKAPHCSNQDSPLTNTGYILKMLPRAELREIVQAINLYLKNRKGPPTMTGKDRVLVKIIKETPDKICKADEQFEVSEEGANELIKHGYAQPLTQNNNALVTNREHAQIHLAILGERQKYLVTVNKHNEELEYNQIIPFTQEQNNKGFSVWVSLNPKNKDGTKGVTHLADFWLDIDRPKATKDNTRPATKKRTTRNLRTRPTVTTAYRNII